MRALVLALLLFLPFAAIAQTAEEERDRSFLSDLIESALSDVTRAVRIDGFRGALSSQATVRRLSIADSQGEWLVAENLTLDWTRAALFEGRIDVNRLSAGTIRLLRAPLSEPDLPTPEAVPFALPDLPVSVDLRALVVDRLEIGAALLGEAMVLRLDGAVQLAGGEGTARLSALRTEGPPGRFDLTGSFANATRVLGLNLTLDEGEGGIAARLLGVPDTPPLSLSLVGTAPIDSYAADLRLASDGVDRVRGAFALGTTAAADGGLERDFSLSLQGDVTPLLVPDLRDFFGTDLTLGLRGQLLADGTLDLPALAIRAQAVRLDGSARIGPGGWPEAFALTGRIAAPDGAPVRLPGAAVTVGAMTLSLSHDGAAGDGWQGDFRITDLVTAGARLPDLRLTGGGAISAATDDSPGAFSAALQYAAEGVALDDPALARAIGPSVRGEVVLGRSGGEPLRLSRATVTGPGLTLSAVLEVAGPDSGFGYAADVTLTAADLGRFDMLTGLALGGAAELVARVEGAALDGTIALTAEGTTRDLRLGIPTADTLIGGAGQIALTAVRDAAGARIETLQLTTPALSGTGAATLTSGDSSGRFDLRLDDAGRVVAGLTGPLTLTGEAALTAGGPLALGARAELPGAVLDVAFLRPDPAAPAVLDLRGDLPDLAAFAAAAGLDLRGAAGMTARGTIGPAPGVAEIALALDTRDLGIGQAVADSLLAGEGTIRAMLRADGAGGVTLSDIDLRTALVTATGRAAQDAAGRSADLALQLTDAGTLAPGLSGPLTADLRAGQDAGGDVTLDLRAGLMGAGLGVTGRLPADEGAFAGRVALAAPDVAPFAALAGVAVTGGAELAAEGRVALDLMAADLALSGTLRDIDPGVAPVRPLLAGAGTLAGRIARTDGGPWQAEGLRLTTSAANLRLDGAAGAAGTAADLALTLADLSLLAEGLGGTGTLVATVRRDEAGIIAATASAQAAGADLRLTVAANGADPMAGLTVRADLTAPDLSPWSGLTGQRLSGGLSAQASGTATPADGTFAVDLAATTRNIDPGIAALAPVLSGEGRIAARVERTAAGLILARGLDVAFPNLTVTAAIEGTEATFAARLRDVALLAPGFDGPATAEGRAAMTAAGDWQVTTALTGPGGARADVAGTVRADGRLDLTARGAAPLGLANGFIEPQRIEGMADVDLRLAGPAGIDALSGTLRITGARIAAPALGLSLNDLGGSVALRTGRAQIDLRAAAETGGSVTVAGGIGLTGGLEADLRVTLAALGLRDPALYATTASGSVTVAGPLARGARIAGSIDLGPAEVQIPSSGVGGLGDLPPVIHLGTPGAVAQTLARAGLTATGQEAAGSSGPAHALDLTIRAPSRVFIRGRGLDAELGGTLRLGGTTANIVASGGFALIRGRIDILQQRFVLTEGSADLQGDFVPNLRLVAETTARTGTRISIIVAGPATAPDVSFRAVPDLPQDEVLAQLLFGRDLSAITPLQAVQLAAAVGTLAGTGGGGIIAGLRTNLGLDDFDVVTGEDGGTALRVGKYLSENVYTDVTVGSETSVNINLDLTEDITVTGSVTSGGDTRLGVFFERDY